MEYEKPVLICLDEKELASQILAMARSVNPGGCLYYGVYSWDAYNCSTGAVTIKNRIIRAYIRTITC